MLEFKYMKNQRGFINISVIIIFLLVIGGGSYIYLYNNEESKTQNELNEITSFVECINAGNYIMESYPRQCRTESGELFVEEIEKDDNSKEFVVCTTDTMQCPDGSWVKRTGPNCEFVCKKENEPYWLNDQIILLQFKESLKYSCIGCNKEDVCIDYDESAENSILTETEDLYCDNEFRVVINESGETTYVLDKKFTSEYFGLFFMLPSEVAVKGMEIGADHEQAYLSNQIEISRYDLNKIDPFKVNNDYIITTDWFTIIDVTNHPKYIDKNLQEIVEINYENYNRNRNFEVKEIDSIIFEKIPAYKFSIIDSRDKTLGSNFVYFEKNNMVYEIQHPLNHKLSKDIFDSIKFN
jgi:hypothetical protein